METTPLATALSTYLSDPANAKAMMQTLVAAACASSSDNAGATALGGNYVHLLVDKLTGAVKFRSEADDAAVASGMGLVVLNRAFNIGDTFDIPTNDYKGIVLLCYKNALAGIVNKSYIRISFSTSHTLAGNYFDVESIMEPDVIRVTVKRNAPSGYISYKVLC